MPRYDTWTGHSMADNNYENPQVSPKQFAPEPRRLGAPEPHKPAFKPHPRRSTDMQVDNLVEEKEKEDFWDYLESAMNNTRSGPGLPGDQYRDSDGKIRIRMYHANDLHRPEAERRVWLIEADNWGQVLQQLNWIDAESEAELVRAGVRP